MRRTKKHSIFSKLISLVLCMSMMLGSFVITSFASVAQEESESEYALAVRVIDDIKLGGKFTNDRLEIVRVRKDALPEGAYTSVSDLKGKFAASYIMPGDFITPAKVTDTKPEGAVEEDKDTEEIVIDPYELGYVVVTKYKEFVEAGDYAPAIKKAIEENPGRTIYFPDGRYNIKSPIVISADPTKSVSLRLSNQTVISAAEWGDDKTVAMIQIGCDEENAADGASVPSMEELDFSAQKSISIIGGCIYGSNLASGIAVGGGKDTYIYNVSIKSTYNGIHLKKANNELGATYVNIDNVNISGMEAVESSGVLIESTYNTLSNMRIASVNYGVLCTETGSNNIFRNLHPLVVGMNNVYTVGFWDKSDGNNFDICYSDQFSAGYRVEENTRAVMNGGFCYWWTERNDYHVGYEASGKFNSIIVSAKVAHGHSVKTDAYLYVGAEGGQGVVLYPINSVVNKDMYGYMLDQHCKTPAL